MRMSVEPTQNRRTTRRAKACGAKMVLEGGAGEYVQTRSFKDIAKKSHADAGGKFIVDGYGDAMASDAVTDVTTSKTREFIGHN